MPGRIRTIKPELLDDEKTSALSDAAFRLFVAAIILADDYGNLRASPNWLRGQVWHSRESREPFANVAREVFAEYRLLDLYSVGGQAYAHIRGWAKHQRVDKPGHPRCPRETEGSPLTCDDLLGDSRTPRERFANDSRMIRAAVAPDPDLRPNTTDADADADADHARAREDVPERTADRPRSRTALICDWHRAAMIANSRGNVPPDLAGAALAEPFLAHLSDAEAETVINSYAASDEAWPRSCSWALRGLNGSEVTRLIVAKAKADKPIEYTSRVGDNDPDEPPPGWVSPPKVPPRVRRGVVPKA